MIFGGGYSVKSQIQNLKFEIWNIKSEIWNQKTALNSFEGKDRKCIKISPAGMGRGEKF